MLGLQGLPISAHARFSQGWGEAMQHMCQAVARGWCVGCRRVSLDAREPKRLKHAGGGS